MSPRSDDFIVPVTMDLMEPKLNSSQPLTRPSYSICRFPDFFIGIPDEIRSPLLASIGPCHYDPEGQSHLNRFQTHKRDLLRTFLSRTGRDRSFYYEELRKLKDKIKGCYSPEIREKRPSDDELLEIMLLDGCFMVELFHQYDEERNQIPPQLLNQTLIADLLKLENQVPFFVLEELYRLSNEGNHPPTPTNLPDLALRYLSQAFRNFSEMEKSVVQDPLHLLDLFRRSLLPPGTTSQDANNQYPPIHPIQSVKQLWSVGIRMRQKAAKSLLEIDFINKLLHIPPFVLKIPPLAIDGLTNAILVNCVALEQCLQGQTKHFTAYACFMSCLVKEKEDVVYLRSKDIINGIPGDEDSFINMLCSIGSNVHSTLRESYLWKQLQEIHCYYNGCCASFIRSVSHNKIVLCFSLLTLVLGILTWRLPAKKPSAVKGAPAPM